MIRVLVADDEPLIRAGIRTVLESAPDIEVVAQAEDGRAAVAAAVRHRADVALIDIRMPVLDGLGATSRLRAAGFWRPIVALTASAAAEQRAACLAAGCNDHLTKPIAPEDLVSKVAAVCRRLA